MSAVGLTAPKRLGITPTFGGLILPQYARLDLAYEEATDYPAQPAGQGWSVKVPGDTIYIPVSIVVGFATSATVAARTVVLQVTDANAMSVFQIPAFTTQTQSLTYAYSFVSSTSVAYGPIGIYNLAPIPPLAAPPSYSFAITVSNEAAGDQITLVNTVFIKVPTGPTLSSSIALTPTPLIA